MPQLATQPAQRTFCAPFRKGMQAFKDEKELDDYTGLDRDYDQWRAGWLHQEDLNEKGQAS